MCTAYLACTRTAKACVWSKVSEGLRVSARELEAMNATTKPCRVPSEALPVSELGSVRVHASRSRQPPNFMQLPESALPCLALPLYRCRWFRHASSSINSVYLAVSMTIKIENECPFYHGLLKFCSLPSYTTFETPPVEVA
ncbi:hypothetical protein GE21DRAFT_1201486 [Neurospora crassa]|nr:hypothetical protein B14D6.330 [imported] - Neurospora crassa [Neurospora crassa]KHE87630.1 hypothetical protein GE21DRAFT_1201486 [Neurospora crassa]